MRLKCLLFFISISVFVNGFTQDQVRVVINGRKVGETKIGDDPLNINISKLKYKDVGKVTLFVNQPSLKGAYKRTLEITDDNEINLLSVDESPSKASCYKINLTPVRSKLLLLSVIKVFIAESPANDMMRLPSRRKLLAQLHFL